MSKYDEFVKIITPLLDEKKTEEIEKYLTENSNLPGRRANLELANAFADYFQNKNISKEFWELLCKLNNINSLEAPTDTPAEFLPFSAVQAFGSIYLYVDEEKQKYILNTFKNAMNDSRWRMREAIAMSFQRIAEKDFDVIKNLFSDLFNESNFLEKRTIIAALAHPPILDNKDTVLFSLKLSEEVLDNILSSTEAELKTEDFTILSKGMEYSVSVFVEKLPEEGFDLLKKFATTDNKKIKKILKSNLGKARLKKKYPNKVNEILAII